MSDPIQTTGLDDKFGQSYDVLQLAELRFNEMHDHHFSWSSAPRRSRLGFVIGALREMGRPVLWDGSATHV